ncbi:DJ-1/PfpI family protein [Veronia pacifica]|uniref:DJ-1/PfpI domain-containing protein n=1 Tax=Veronia pacifica TaxID=1080227 RepID=A0A1C3EIG8_9GAMM|nr:DJ-1/PfpI family protein [Veronia pacifica]ODA33046.1 hypothetical protein A8L45_11785 [Veronia pacifica]
MAILTLSGFSEIDSLVAYSMLNRLKSHGLLAKIVSEKQSVCSSNGLTVSVDDAIRNLAEYDAIIIGSGINTRKHIENATLMRCIHLYPERQIIASQCSGALVLDRLQLLPIGFKVSCDEKTQEFLHKRNVEVSGESFSSQDNVASAGGCLAAEHLSAWVAFRLLGLDATTQMLEQVLPVKGKTERIATVLKTINAQ